MILPATGTTEPRCRCGKLRNRNGLPVTWRCHICKHLVCGECTLTIPGSNPREYYALTLCSPECWAKAGRPDD